MRDAHVDTDVARPGDVQVHRKQAARLEFGEYLRDQCRARLRALLAGGGLRHNDDAEVARRVAQRTTIRGRLAFDKGVEVAPRQRVHARDRLRRRGERETFVIGERHRAFLAAQLEHAPA